MVSSSTLTKFRLNHFLFWAAVFIVWYILRMDDYASRAMAMQVTFIKVTDLALLIYITNYLLIPRLLYKKRYVWFGLIFIGMIIVSSIIKMNLTGRMLNNPALTDWSKDLKGRIYDNILPHFFLVTAGAAVKLMFDYGILQQRMAETAKEKAEAELNFLKSQINPHFVFNSLNSVYFLINKDNTAARDALHKFSDMLRYQLYEMNGQKIPVENEIRYLKDYMALQQLRKNENYTVEFDCKPSVGGFTIEPLLLIPLVENAFKHVSHFSNKMNYIKLKMDLIGNTFVFNIENSKDNLPSTEEKGGIGLQNVKRRLELLYPDAHNLEIQDSDNTFLVSLKLQLA